METTRTRAEVTYTFNIPAKMQADVDGIKSITLKELTAHDELLATKRSNGDAFALAFELAKQALVGIDGSTVNAFDHTMWHSAVLVLKVGLLCSLHMPRSTHQSPMM